MRRHHKNVSAFISLCLVAAISPGLALCVCCDGGADFRPVFHIHHGHHEHTDSAHGSHPPHEPVADHEGDHGEKCLEVPLFSFDSEHGVPGNPTGSLVFLLPVEGETIEAQADSLAWRSRRISSKTPYFSLLRSIILVV